MSRRRARAPRSAGPPTPAANITATRVLDVTLATAALVVLAPLMFLVAIAILVDDGRPIFFAQLRLGRRRQLFHMYKFRKFHARERQGGYSVTLEDDPRLTRVGGFLARSKFDELPQLWNVLKGDMSAVGPRPEALDFQDCFKDSYEAVLEHKPGIFGPSQILFRNEGSLYRGCSDPEQFYREILFPLKARIDLAYFPNRSLLWDLGWLVRGALAVFGRSAVAREGTGLVEEAESWIRKGGAHHRGLPPPLPLLAGISRRRAVEIVRDGRGRASASTEGRARRA